jgi:hypothetical protein
MGGESIDSRDEDWLGHHCPMADIRESELWNIDHVSERYQPEFLDTLGRYIDDTPELG